jgi:hypothetical protein
MHCWLWLVWEKVVLFQVCVRARELPLAFSCERDSWLMLVFVAMGFTDDELICLNCVQCHQQVIIYSDIFDSGGKVLD